MRRRVINFALLVVAVLAVGGDLAQGPQLSIDNVYSYRQNGFYWTVFVHEDATVLQKVRCVQYTLHPTFPTPVQRTCDRTKSFALNAVGWGEFTILLKIEWINGRTTFQSYRLDLHSASRRDRKIPDRLRVH